VSKLFDTLEKIRSQEKERLARERPAAFGGRKRRVSSSKRPLAILLVFLLLAAAVGALVLLPERATSPFFDQTRRIGRDLVASLSAFREQPAVQKPRTPVRQPPPVKPDASSPSVALDPMIRLNNAGVDLLKNNDHWRAVLYFERASKADPASWVPLFNQAVALYELGLSGPAQTLLDRALERGGRDHPLVRRNLAVLAENGLRDGGGHPAPRTLY